MIRCIISNVKTIRELDVFITNFTLSYVLIGDECGISITINLL